VFNTAQQVGGALGLAVLTTLAASRTGTAHTAQALTSGYHLAWTVGTILAGASIAVAAIALRQEGRPHRRHQAHNRSAGNQAESAADPLGTRRDTQSTAH
jgi:hypothetical protein